MPEEVQSDASRVAGTSARPAPCEENARTSAYFCVSIINQEVEGFGEVLRAGGQGVCGVPVRFAKSHSTVGVLGPLLPGGRGQELGPPVSVCVAATRSPAGLKCTVAARLCRLAAQGPLPRSSWLPSCPALQGPSRERGDGLPRPPPPRPPSYQTGPQDHLTWLPPKLPVSTEGHPGGGASTWEPGEPRLSTHSLSSLPDRSLGLPVVSTLRTPHHAQSASTDLPAAHRPCAARLLLSLLPSRLSHPSLAS